MVVSFAKCYKAMVREDKNSETEYVGENKFIKDDPNQHAGDAR